MTADAAAAPAAEQPLLGVFSSFCGRPWRARAYDARIAQAVAQRCGVPDLVGRVLAGRGIGLDAAEAFLRPRLRDCLPDPFALHGMRAAVDRLVAAVTGGERIALFGDYDVDGATSTALLARFLTNVGAEPVIYIPDRMSEGYGPNAPALAKLRAEGCRVAVTLDCGTTAFEPLAAAAAVGLDVVVVDHHVAEPVLPTAVAVVNPNRLDEPGGLGHLAAVGVTFLLLVALNRGLREAGWYGAGRAAEPDLMQWLDLVALGTVCDVVPLTGLNRALVAQGLKVMARRGNLGLATLADVAGVKERPDPYHLGFMLGPRVNAGGRIGRSDLGARLLGTMDAALALEIAADLDRFNRERQDIEQGVLEAALAAVEREGDPGPVVFVAGDGWHPGVIGIVASRLVERYGRPACVVAVADGVGKGSGRSVAGAALGAAVIAARQAGLLTAGGGHDMAAGFTADAGRLAAVHGFLAARFRDIVPAGGIVRPLMVDAPLTPRAADASLLRLLESIGPYGMGHAEPRFVLPAVRVERPAVVGENHVRCTLSDGAGGRLKGIAFRCVAAPLGEALLRGGPPLHVAGRLRADTWQGPDGVQFMIDDAAPA